jgi:hypothetical protein
VAAGDGSSASSLIALSRSSLSRETIRVTLFPFQGTYSVPFTPYFTFFFGASG